MDEREQSQELDQRTKRRVREQFAGSGDAYVLSSTHREGVDLARLLEIAELSPLDNALDIATGGGHTALALAPFVKTVTLADLTPEMLAQARRYLHQQGARPRGFVAADAESLPLQTSCFQVVTCRIAPHHFPYVPGFVREVARVLAPGGRFLLIDSVAPEAAPLDEFINTLEFRRDPSHVRSHTRHEWRKYVERAGLRIEHEEVIQKRHDFPLWTARSRMTAGASNDLEAFALAAGDEVAAYFEFDVQDGRLMSFKDEKLLLKARKPA